jgi:hypothetical protein
MGQSTVAAIFSLIVISADHRLWQCEQSVQGQRRWAWAAETSRDSLKTTVVTMEDHKIYEVTRQLLSLSQHWQKNY